MLVPLYVWLKPDAGGWLNLIVGSLGLGSMIAMMAYSIARRSKTLREILRLSTWLHLHIFLGLTIFLIFPFTRLVHMLSVPIRYVWRPGYQVVRSRRPAGAHRAAGAQRTASTAAPAE